MHWTTRLGFLAPAVLVAHLGARVPAQQEKEPPRVVELEPANGAMEVDAEKTKKIVVKFDRKMSTGGFSFCGGGPSFPNGQRPYWKDGETCVREVELEPDHTYVMSLNCPSAHNFRSADGVPLEPLRWTFSTLPEKLPSKQKQRAANKKALDELVDVLEASYSYYDLRGLDWAKLQKEHRNEILTCRTTRGWTAAVGRMLEPTEDIHLHLRYGDQVVATGRRAVDPLYRGDLLRKYLPEAHPAGDGALVGRTEDGIGYLLIGGWTGALDMDAIEKELMGLRSAKAIVVDVRPNSGGDETLARRVAEWFVEGTKVYAKDRYRTGKGENGFGPVLERSITGNDGEKRIDLPVAVLTTRYVMSSCEAFVLMMRQAKDCTVVGQPTYGSSGNPKPHELSNGVTVVVPSWQAMLPDGTCFEGVGIAPDVLVEVDPKELAERDPILERALAVLREKIGNAPR